MLSILYQGNITDSVWERVQLATKDIGPDNA